MHAAGTSAVRESTAERRGLHLLGGALRVVTRGGAVDDATTGELRSTGRTLTGAAGALLLVRLAATTTDLATALRVVGALASRRELRDDDLVDQRDVGLHVEDLGGQLGRAGLLALGVDDVDSQRVSHGHAPFTAERTTTTPPLGPGTAPLTRSRPLSTSTACTVRFWVVWRSHAHATGHLDALEHARRRRSATDRAGLAVVAVRTVRGADAVEAVTLHDTGGALALGGADDVDELAGLEEVGRELLAERVLGGVRRADLDHVPARRDAGLLEVALQRLVDLARVDLRRRPAGPRRSRQRRRSAPGSRRSCRPRRR